MSIGRILKILVILVVAILSLVFAWFFQQENNIELGLLSLFGGCMICMILARNLARGKRQKGSAEQRNPRIGKL